MVQSRKNEVSYTYNEDTGYVPVMHTSVVLGSLTIDFAMEAFTEHAAAPFCRATLASFVLTQKRESDGTQAMEITAHTVHLASLISTSTPTVKPFVIFGPKSRDSGSRGLCFVTVVFDESMSYLVMVVGSSSPRKAAVTPITAAVGSQVVVTLQMLSENASHCKVSLNDSELKPEVRFRCKT